MKEHLCILWCYNNFEHIAKCFDSIYMDEVDYFIVENRSEYSKQIEDFFAGKRLAGYIQFQENIADNAVKIFLKDYRDFIKQYEYITFSDGDLLIDDIRHTFAEMGGILQRDDIGVVTVDLKMDNFPHHLAKPSDWLPAPTRIADIYVECLTGAHLMTLRRENMDIMFNVNRAIDNDFRMACASKGLKWVKTKISKAYHLTWDYYRAGHPYYEFRKNNPNIFKQTKTCNYKTIV